MDIRFDTFQSKTSTNGEKITPAHVVEEVPQRSQAGAIGLGGRKGENGHAACVADALEEARERWLEIRNELALRGFA